MFEICVVRCDAKKTQLHGNPIYYLNRHLAQLAQRDMPVLTWNYSLWKCKGLLWLRIETISYHFKPFLNKFHSSAINDYAWVHADPYPFYDKSWLIVYLHKMIKYMWYSRFRFHFIYHMFIGWSRAKTPSTRIL